jgi:hypothetical protein
MRREPAGGPADGPEHERSADERDRIARPEPVEQRGDEPRRPDADARAAIAPMPTSIVMRDKTRRMMPAGAAPGAMRIPISVRRLTAYAVTPLRPRRATPARQPASRIRLSGAINLVVPLRLKRDDGGWGSGGRLRVVDDPPDYIDNPIPVFRPAEE